MPAPNSQVQLQEVPLKIVGGTHFGRYNKISLEETWNFIVSDGWLVPYAGYKNQLNLAPALKGRGLYSSFVDNAMYGVIGAGVYRINVSLSTGLLESTLLGNLFTNDGDVYIAENNNGQICITDGIYVYVYNYLTPTTPLIRSSNPASTNSFDFGDPAQPFTNPGYISFQNGRLIIACTSSTNWVLSGFNDATSWPFASQNVGSLQTKPDHAQACVPMPGGGNNLLVFGRNVTELWQDVGAALFPYQRNSTFNVDYGCLNPATVAHLKNYVVWLAVNEQSGPVLMVAFGNDIQAISTDGIDFQLGNLSDPDNCTGFLYQQDGHVIYQFTFPTDNISYAYDFETKLFFNVSDENLNFHIAREVVYFNNNYYFVALDRGNIYEFNTIYPFAQYSADIIKSIPRIRICPPLRLPSQRYYVAKSLGFTVENGQPNTIRIVKTFDSSGDIISTEDLFNIACENGDILVTEQDNPIPSHVHEYASEQINLAVSRDGGMTFGSFWGKDMNRTGNYKSRFIYQRLGHANDSTYQIRFNGYSRFCATDGICEIYE